jgi:fermentation-respiration switch protein FrsA (DUF1100 family)
MDTRLRRYATVFAKRAPIYLTVILVVGALARVTHVVDRHFIYFPSREITITPGDVGLDFEDVTFKAFDGVTLHGWYVPGAGDVTWIWFHGNGGNISSRVSNILELNRVFGINIFIFDYRGYGRSEGSPSEEGTYLDAEAAIVYVDARDDVDLHTKMYFGRSLGCAVAADMAVRHPPRGLICESGFTSIKAMARSAYPFLPGIELLVSTKYDTLSKIELVKVPVMFLYGSQDDIVPFEMSKELFEAANEPKRFYLIKGAMHNDTYEVGGEPYFNALQDFVDDIIRQE